MMLLKNLQCSGKSTFCDDKTSAVSFQFKNRILLVPSLLNAYF